jgi:hypothetical protein
MTEVGADPHVGGDENVDAPPTVVPTPEDEPTPPPSPERSTVRRTIAVLLRYPRVTIGGVLTVLATVLGLVILPNSGTATSGPSAIFYLLLDRPSNINSYLFFRSDPGINHVVVGMDVPPHVRADWTIYLLYNKQDTIHFAASNSAHLQADRIRYGQQGDWLAVITGSMTSANSFTEFQNGYYSEVTKVIGSSGLATGLPTDIDSIQFTLDGPVPITTAVGSTISVALPALAVQNESPVSGKAAGTAPAPFDSEDFYRAGSYQNLTGGPTLEAAIGWDWFNDGFTPPITATGVDDAMQQSDQNRTFAAAVLFGVAASAVAVFFVELVGAIQEERRAGRSRSSGDLSVG